jgi:predicted Zn-dependent protease
MVGGRRVEIREEHRQRAYSREQILDALAQAGLEAVEVMGFDPFGETRRVKLVFVCRVRRAPRARHGTGRP